jgi:hypothetical protein
VNINIPSTLLKEDVDLNNYAKENNFKSATKKEDGTVDITMTTKKYNELLKETSQTIEESFAKLVTDTNFLKDITHNKDFTEITMLVDKSIYNGSFDITPLSLYLNASMYQLIAQIESKCTVLLKIIQLMK